MTLIEAVLLVCAGKVTETKIQEWGTQNQDPKTERRPVIISCCLPNTMHVKNLQTPILMLNTP